VDENCHVDALHKAPSVEERREHAAAILAVSGMGCPNCANRVRNSLLQVYGVLSVDIALEVGMARVAFNPVLAGPTDLTRAVAAAGGDGRHEYRAQVIG
jgi:copper chaperone CopZ